MIQVVVLCANGEYKSSKIADISAAGIAKATRKVKHPEILGTYTWNEQILTLWGWKEGRAGTENKHELPLPHDKGRFFSDIIVASSQGDFTVAAWKEFYEAALKGFEVLDDEDTDNEEGAVGGADADINGDADAEVEAEVEIEEEEEDFEEEEEEEEIAGEDEGDGDGEGDDGSAAGSEDAEEEEEDIDEECYDSDEGGGGKRRAPRRRAMAAPEYRRMDMGLRSKIKLPAQIGRRAPRWQTGPQLEPEA